MKRKPIRQTCCDVSNRNRNKMLSCWFFHEKKTRKVSNEIFLS